MASDLQNVLQRIANKGDVLLEKYRVLVEEKKSLEEEISALRSEKADMQLMLQKLRQENEYLRLARTMAATPQQLEQNKVRIAKMVRDIDKCISQLTD